MLSCFSAVCNAGYLWSPVADECFSCGDIQTNTFKSTPGNATTCTPCDANTVANAGYTACGMLIILAKKKSVRVCGD